MSDYGYSPEFTFIRTRREWRRWVKRVGLLGPHRYIEDTTSEEFWKEFDEEFSRPKEFPFAVHYSPATDGRGEDGDEMIFLTKGVIKKVRNMLDRYDTQVKHKERIKYLG